MIQLLAAGMAEAQFLDSSQQPSELLPYTQCRLEGGLAPIAVERAPNLPMARPIDTSSGRKTVSVADGYRVMLAFPNTDPFVNLKIERSALGQYSSDKEGVLEQMQYMSANAANGATEFKRSVKRGIDVAELNRPDFKGGVISFYTLFDDKKSIIATAYILNQEADRRAFKDMADFRSRRDKFIQNYVSCMAAIRER
jgi:hypothetical protein